LYQTRAFITDFHTWEVFVRFSKSNSKARGCVLALVSFNPIAGVSVEKKDVLNYSFKGGPRLLFFNLNNLPGPVHKYMIGQYWHVKAPCFFTCVRLLLGGTDEQIDSRRYLGGSFDCRHM
jgi:hypothetical protein